MILPRAFAAATCCVFLLAGCSQKGPMTRPEGVKVTGTVLLPSGSPLTGGTLILRPESGLYGATAEIQTDGRFTLHDTANNQDVVPGRYQVFISFPNPSHLALKKSIPIRYQESDDSNSDLFVDIGESTQPLVIRLKR